MGQQPFSLAKQVRFALAVTLTAVAKEAQDAVVTDIESTFTVRNNWDKPSNAMGVKVLPASKHDLSAAVATRADWLNLHEEGGTKKPAGRNLAIPTQNVRRTKRDLIQKSQRPKALRGKRTFVLQTKNGPVLYQRKGKGKRSQIVALYRLKPSARIKKQSTVAEPTLRVFGRRFDAIFERELTKALATARRGGASEAKGVWAFD